MALPQPLHIFRKDVLHLWPETLIALVLIVAFAWAAPSGWQQSQFAGVVTLLAAFLKYFLVPISWLVVISRLIHDETLVGDRQFWTSRPYDWRNLLAAKVIYLLVFIYLPFFLMQVFLLKHAGLYPTLAIPALLHNLLLLTVIVVVPLTAIAAVTGTFARMLLSSIGAVIYVIIVALGVTYLALRRMPPPGIEWLLIGIVVLLPAIALVYQYATRKTTTSRIMLAVTPVLVALLLFAVPAGALIRHSYPVISGKDAPALAQLPDNFMPKTTPGGKLVVQGGMVFVGVPVAVSGVDQKTSYVVGGVDATLDGPGVHWTSGYMNEGAKQLGAFSPFARIDVAIPVDVFNRVAKAPIDLHMALAAQHLKADEPTQWKATLLPFSVPGHGICSYPADDPDANPTCRYPFKTPELNYVTAMVAGRSCSAPAAPPTLGRMSLGIGAAFLDFDPVVMKTLAFETQDTNADHHYVLCPGTELNFIEAKELGRVRMEVDEKQIVLDPLAERFSGATPAQTP